MFHVKHEDSKKKNSKTIVILRPTKCNAYYLEKTIYVILEIVSVGNFKSIIDPALDLFVCAKKKTS